MAHTRVHELAKEFGVESRSVVAKLRAQGCFVKSAASQVPVLEELRLRTEANAAAAVSPDGDARAWFLSVEEMPNNRGVSRPSHDPDGRPAPSDQRRARTTTWDGSIFGPDGEQLWRRAGLGDFDEPLARFLLDHGIWPEDLRVPIRGTAAVNRLRSGEASWHVLVAELREARAAPSPSPPEPPSRAVSRRHRGA